MADSAALERLVGDDSAMFGELLVHLSNPDTVQRKQAEAAFASLKERFPEGLVLKLLLFVKESPEPKLRSFAATLLRQVLVKERPSLWTSVGKEHQDRIRGDLIGAVTHESDRDVRLKASTIEKVRRFMDGAQVADVIADLFSKILGSECWPELVQFLCHTIQQQHQTELSIIVEACVYILAEIAPVWSDSMEHSVDQFVAMMKMSLSNQDAAIRLVAIKAIKSFALSLEDDAEIMKLKTLMQDLLMAFSAVNVGAPQAPQAYATLIELAEYIPSLFEDVLRPLFTEFINRAKDPQDVNSQTMTLEFLLTLVDGIPESQTESLKDCIAEIVALLMNSLLMIEDVPDWSLHCGTEDGAPSFGDMHDLATESIDRLATSLPSEIFLPLVSHYAQQWASDPDWKKRHAVLNVVGQMAEGCSSDLAVSIMPLLEICTRGLSDPHVRVRWAACQAIGLVADEVGDIIQKSHRDHIIEQLMQASIIDDPSAVSVQEHALQCLVNLLQNSEHSLKGPNLDNMIKWILQSLNFEHESVKSAALSVLTCVASLFEAPLFAPYYNECMKAAFSAIQRIKDPNDLEQIATIICTITRIGAGAGKDCFFQEYKLIVEYLKGLLDQSANMSDLQDRMSVSIHVLDAAARLASIMKSDFDALEVFRELILQALATEPKLETIPVEDMEDSGDDDQFKIVIAGKCFRMEAVSLEFCKRGMKTAMGMARNLKQGFFPMLVPVLEAFLPAMNYKLMRDIRQTAIQAQPILLECATAKHRAEPTDDTRDFVLTLLNKQWEAYMGKLGDMGQEPNEMSSPAILETISKTIEVLQGNLEPAMMEVLFERLQYLFQHFTKLRTERAAVQEGELTPEEMEEFTEEVSLELCVILGIQKVLTAIMVHTNDQYFSQITTHVTSLHQLMGHLTDEPVDHEILEAILTSMTDVCDYSSRGRETYASDVCQLFLANLEHTYEGVRQISAFGISIIAQKAPSVFQPMAVSVMQKLAQIIETLAASAQEIRETDAAKAMAFDNIVSALGKILETHGHVLGDEDQAQLLRVWLHQLPLRHDTEEAPIAHHQLLKAVLEQDTKLLGKDKEYLMKVIDILMEILANEKTLATAEDLKQISELLKEMEHENGCRQFAEQKLQKWTEEEKAQFHYNMNGTVP